MSVDELRIKILDRPQVVTGERVGTGDGTRVDFSLAHAPVVENTVILRVEGLQLNEGSSYSLDYGTGKLFIHPTGEGKVISADYEFAAFTDAELAVFLDEGRGDIRIGAGKALLALIADPARLKTWCKCSKGIDLDRLRLDLRDVANKYLGRE